MNTQLNRDIHPFVLIDTPTRRVKMAPKSYAEPVKKIDHAIGLLVDSAISLRHQLDRRASPLIHPEIERETS
jgi:hypothetical protein